MTDQPLDALRHARAVLDADQARARDLLPVTPDPYAALDRYAGPFLLDLALDLDDDDDPRAATMAVLLAVFRAERMGAPGRLYVEHEGQSYGLLFVDHDTTTTTSTSTTKH